MNTVNYNNKNYKAIITDWTDGSSAATIKIGKKEILLKIARDENGDKSWVKA
jgi:hypothetical protein